MGIRTSFRAVFADILEEQRALAWLFRRVQLWMSRRRLRMVVLQFLKCTICHNSVSGLCELLLLRLWNLSRSFPLLSSHEDYYDFCRKRVSRSHLQNFRVPYILVDSFPTHHTTTSLWRVPALSLFLGASFILSDSKEIIAPRLTPLNLSPAHTRDINHAHRLHV